MPTKIALSSNVITASGRALGTTGRPDSCRVELFANGSESVGPHSEDQQMFKREDDTVQVLILALGAARSMHWRPKRRGAKQRGSRGAIQLRHGTLALMEGRMQAHFQHYTPPEEAVTQPHMRLTWKWIQQHTEACRAHGRALASNGNSQAA